MRIKKSDLLIGICVILICLNNIVLAKSKSSNKSYAMKSEIAVPVIEIIKDDPIKSEVYQNSFPIEYNFCINNYDENSVNEVDFDYVIEIENSAENFPVSYELFDCDNNTEVRLVDGKSEALRLERNEKQSRKFKLILQWKEQDVDLADKLQLNLKITAVQSREGIIDESL